MSSPPSLTVVIPTYNERDSLPALFEGLAAVLPEASLLLVDDGSPDGTAQLARELARERELSLEIIEREGKRGLASAYVTGFRRALDRGAERIIQMDADGSHDPAALPALLSSSADLVLGSRYVPGGGTRNWPLHRRLLSRFGSTYARLWLGLPLQDLTGGFKVWRRDTLAIALADRLASEGYAFQVEMTLRAWRAGARVEELPITFVERVEGQSKMSQAIALEAAFLVPRLRWRR